MPVAREHFGRIGVARRDVAREQAGHTDYVPTVFEQMAVGLAATGSNKVALAEVALVWVGCRAVEANLDRSSATQFFIS
jgi:hypothetical protein